MVYTYWQIDPQDLGGRAQPHPLPTPPSQPPTAHYSHPPHQQLGLQYGGKKHYDSRALISRLDRIFLEIVPRYLIYFYSQLSVVAEVGSGDRA